jgi:hypothetical protein
MSEDPERERKAKPPSVGERQSPRAWAKPPSVGRKEKPPSVGRKEKPPSVGRKAKPPSMGRKAKPPSVGEAPGRGSKDKAPEHGRSPRAWVERPSPRAWAKPPSVGRKAKPPSVGEAPERKHTQMSIHEMKNLNFIAWCRRHNVGRGLLPMLDYIVEGVGEAALLAKGRSGTAARRSTGSLCLFLFLGCVGGMPLLG